MKRIYIFTTCLLTILLLYAQVFADKSQIENFLHRTCSGMDGDMPVFRMAAANTAAKSVPAGNADPKRTDIQSQIYQSIRKGITDASDRVDLSKLVGKAIKSEQVFSIMNKVLDDNPDLFYLSYSDVTYWSNGILELKYRYQKKLISEMKNALSRSIEMILKTCIKDGMSEFDRELALHDYIVTHTKYDFNNFKKNTVPAESYTVYGILVKGTGVCEGYAKAVKLLLNRAGIECMIVSGEAKSFGVWQSHAWNIVKIDGSYYHLDTTFDDPVPDRVNGKAYGYFNLNDSQIKVNHKWDTLKYPQCKETKNTYFYRNNMVVSNYSNFFNRISDMFKAKKTGLLVKIIGYDRKIYDISGAVRKVSDDNPDIGYYVSRISWSEDEDMGILDIKVEYTNK